MPQRRVVSTERAPKAIGPYSQGIVSGDLLFLSGQVPIDPATGELVAGGIEPQVVRVLDNLRAVLEAAGCGFPQVVRTTVYLTDLKDFDAMNAVYARYFNEVRPARATVQVTALPRGARVEIDAIAALR
jgi:2-iminobutanoate/2-iminopropanoate deaminase